MSALGRRQTAGTTGSASLPAAEGNGPSAHDNDAGVGSELLAGDAVAGDDAARKGEAGYSPAGHPDLNGSAPDGGALNGAGGDGVSAGGSGRNGASPSGAAPGGGPISGGPSGGAAPGTGPSGGGPPDGGPPGGGPAGGAAVGGASAVSAALPSGGTQASPGGAPAAAPVEPPSRRRHRWLPRTVRRLAEVLLLGFIVEYFVIPQIGGTHKALHVLASVNPFLPVLGVLLEVLSLVAYFELTRALIPKSSDPGFATVSRIQLSTLALSHVLPGGNAMGYSLGYRLLMRSGVGGSDTAVALATQGLGSAVVLNVIFWLALLVSLPLYGLRSGYLFVAVLGLLLMAAIAGLVILLTKGDRRAMAFVAAVGRRVPFLHPETLPRLFGQLVARVEELSKDRRQMGKALFFATANWLFDAGSLFVFVGAFGHWVNPVALLVAYGVANIVAALPITPGGLGVVEATVSGILVGFGTPRSIAIWGVLAWRLVNFWLPIPIGGTAFLSLQLHPPAGSQAGLAARRALWRARWRWVAQMFRADTQTPVVEDSLPIIGTVVPEEGDAGGGAGDGKAEAPGPVGAPAGAEDHADERQRAG